MLVKTAVCEEAEMCEKCHRYHSSNVNCSSVVTLKEAKVQWLEEDSTESINTDTSNVSE